MIRSAAIALAFATLLGALTVVFRMGAISGLLVMGYIIVAFLYLEKVRKHNPSKPS